MFKKGLLIGTFVEKDRILSFLELLKRKFNVNIEKVFVYDINGNDKEYLVTFKTFNKDKFIKKLSGSTIMHVKNGCIFSINALNKLIDENYNFDDSSTYDDVEIDWNLYKDNLIILTGGKLNINKISKIEDKCSLFDIYIEK